MSPFQYSPYRNPYAGTIAEMLARRGEIAARSAENIGGINARATEQRGAAWAGAAQNIGQIAAGIPLQMQQQREQALMDRYRSAITAKTEQDTQLTADNVEAGKRAQAALAESLARHKRLDGSEDFAAVAVDMASLDPKLATEFQSLDKETKADRDAMRDRAKKYAAENAMTSARIAAQSKDLGNFIARVDMFVADGVMDEGNRNAVLKRAMAAGEDGWPAFQQEIIKGSPEFEKSQADLEKVRADTKPKPPTSFDAAILATTDPAEQARLLKLKAREAAATRTPDKPDYEWVQRGGKATQIKKGTAQAGDTPYRPGTALSADMPSEYQTAVNRAIMSIPMVRRGSVIDTADRLWREGKTKELGEVIKQAAVESEPVDIRNQVRGRDFTLAALADTRVMLNDMKAAGVPTNWLVGTAENLARKLGKSTNTDYAILGNRLMSTLIQYRRAATGVQFSQREQEQYAQMFPNYKNDLPVNMALIEGLERDIRVNNESFWKAKLGDAGVKLIDAGGAAPSAEAGTIRARDPQGNIQEAPAGTKLPAGWELLK